MTQLRVHIGIFAAILAAVGGLLVYQTAKASGASETARDVAVNCGPASRAIVRHAAGQQTVTVECVAADAAVALTASQSWPGAYQEVFSPAAGPMIVPAVYTTATPAQRIVTAPAPRPRTVSQTRTSAARTSERRAGATWQKRALIIGGSAGAGAGVGALIGGKKGALIGAAIGGGGATLIDQIKH